jgi:hypothetical protein
MKRPSGAANPFKWRTRRDGQANEDLVHVLKGGFRCDTERRGHLTPHGRSPLEIVVDASEGFVPLWEENTTLRWTFRESSLQAFEDPAAAAQAIETLLGKAVLAWEDAAPVKFARQDDAWDFEIVVRNADDCDISGCVLASAFFPDPGRHELVLYPKMFEQNEEEQVETLAHEIGHVFGLRHFFAQISETRWASEIFGKHSKFSIMNYGEDSKLTADDRKDLKRLYELVWAGQLTEVNGTPIRLMGPFHNSGSSPQSLVLAEPALVPLRPAARVSKR